MLMEWLRRMLFPRSAALDARAERVHEEFDKLNSDLRELADREDPLAPLVHTLQQSRLVRKLRE